MSVARKTIIGKLGTAGGARTPGTRVMVDPIGVAEDLTADPIDRIVDHDGHEIWVGIDTPTITDAGVWQIELPVTDSEGTNPTGWVWRIRTYLAGELVDTVVFSLPTSTPEPMHADQLYDRSGDPLVPSYAERVDQAAAAALAAEGFRNEASGFRDDADEAAGVAEQHELDAEDHATAAQTARTGAETARTGAETARDAAAGSASTAGTSAGQAASSATAAQTARTGAETARTGAETARDAAAGSASTAAAAGAAAGGTAGGTAGASAGTAAATSYVSGQKGAANGLAPLDGSSKLPEANVPDRLTPTGLSNAIDGHTFDPDSIGYDLMLVAGQSNAAGRGTPVDDRFDAPDRRIFQFGNPASALAAYSNIISRAAEPLYNADTISGTAGIGHAVHLARRLLDSLSPNRRILLVPAAYGGTGFNPSTTSWDPAKIGTDATNLAGAAAAHANRAWAAAEAEYPGANRWVALAWHQGEADSGALTQAQYAGAWDALLAYLRANVTGFATCPAVLGGMVPEWIPTTTGADLIRLAHIDTPYRNLLTGYADGVPGDPNGTPPSLIHYGATAQRTLGLRMFHALRRARLNVMGTAPVTPRTLNLTQSGFNVVAAWSQALSRATDYLVEYKIGAGAWTTLAHTRSLDNTATITGGAAGQTVQVRVSTVNEQGTSAPTAAVSLTLIDVPAALSGLTLGAVTSSAIALSWSASARAAGYLVEYKKHTDSSWTTFGTVTGLAANVIGLSAFTSYDLRVTPVDAAGNGAAGTVSNQVTLAASTVSADVGVAPTHARGLRRLVAGYAGHAITIRRASDNTTLDIDFLGSGDLDTATMETFCAGTDGYITKIWDQSGNGHDATQATTTKQIQLVAAGVTLKLGGKPAATVTSGCFYDVATPGVYAGGAATFLGVAQATTSPTAMALFAEGHSSGTPQARMLWDIGTGQVVAVQYRDDTNTNFASVTGTLPINGAGAHHISIVDTGSLVTAGVDGAWNTGVAYSRSGKTLTLDRAAMFAQPATTYTFFFVGTWCESVIWASALSTSQEAAGRANQKAFYSIP